MKSKRSVSDKCEAVTKYTSIRTKIALGNASCNVMKADYCTEWAAIKCSQSSHYLKMNPVWFTSRPHYGEKNHKGLAVSDCIPDIDYPCVTAPWNMCFSICNPWVLQASLARQAADPLHAWIIVPMPCFLAHVPIGMWKGSNGDHKYSFVPYSVGSLLMSRNPVTVFKSLFFSPPAKVDSLTKNCTLTCLWMGTISIVSNGRDSIPFPYDPVSGLVGPSPISLLRNACGMLMNYTGVAGTLLFGALDSICAGIQEGIDADSFSAGLKAGIVNMLGVGIGLGIGGVVSGVGTKLKSKGAGDFLGNIGNTVKVKLLPITSKKADSMFTKVFKYIPTKYSGKVNFTLKTEKTFGMFAVNTGAGKLIQFSPKAQTIVTGYTAKVASKHGLIPYANKFADFINAHTVTDFLASKNFKGGKGIFGEVHAGNTYQIPNIVDEGINRIIGLFTDNEKTGYKELIGKGIDLLWDTPTDKRFENELAIEDNHDYKAGGTAWDNDKDLDFTKTIPKNQNNPDDHINFDNYSDNSPGDNYDPLNFNSDPTFETFIVTKPSE